MPVPTDRRTFLKATLATGLYGLVRSPAPAAPAASVPDGDWVEAVRAELPGIRHSRGYFQTGAFGLSPQRVMDRTKELIDRQNLGPAHPDQTGYLRQVEQECRELVAKTFGAKPAEVALTANTTAGLNTVLWSIDWRAGDELVISDEEHPGLLLPCYNLVRRFGVVLRQVPLARPEMVVAEVVSRLTPRTRLVAMSHVSRGSGTVAPAAALAAALRPRGVRLLLDGAQGPGNVPLDFHGLGCDYYSLCGHKWLLGPKSTGALLVRADVLESTPPSWTGSNAQASMDETTQRLEWHPDARRYEFSTRFVAGLGGWHEALRWLEGLGWDRIRARQAELSAYAGEAIKATRGLQLISPDDPAQRNGVVVLRLPEGFRATDLYERLRKEDNILVSPVTAPRDLRLSVHFYNTKAEIDLALARVAAGCASRA
ncbi:MAG TPA: aminotransferase class V-fold PLP-dependent enzyme [Lacunisphaera sp.]